MGRTIAESSYYQRTLKHIVSIIEDIDDDKKLGEIFDEIDANKEVGQFTQEEPQQEDQEVEEEEV